MNQNPADQIDFNLDTQNLYREESYTDLKAGAIRRLIPVKADGETIKPERKFLSVQRNSSPRKVRYPSRRD
jgi:hypothetical protein